MTPTIFALTRPVFFATLNVLALCLFGCGQPKLADPSNAGTDSSRSLPPLSKTVKYEPTGEEITNPDRGTNQYWADGETERIPLVASQLKAEKDQYHRSVIYRHYMLSTFTDRPLTGDYLAFLETDANTAREAGVKMIVRFSYEEDKEGCNGDVGAPHARVMEHLGQLKDYFNNSADVIAVVEAGFIGTYGEWYYAHTDYGTCENPKFETRADVARRLLELLPPGRMIAIRSPALKRGIVDMWAKQGLPATQIAGFDKRIGFHDDVFNVDESDMGTFNSEKDREMVAEHTKVSPMLGETSYASLDPKNTFAAFEKVSASAKRYHWSLISRTDDGYVFSSGEICKCDGRWKKPDDCKGVCKEKQLLNRWTPNEQGIFQKSLGYRFVLVDGSFPEKATAGGTIAVTLKLRNEGWTAPFNPYKVDLILRDAAGKDWALPASTLDPTQWFWNDPNKEVPLTISVKLAIGDKPLAAGNYQLLISIADPLFKSGRRADLSIRFANTALWEDATGFNKLNTVLAVE